MITQELLRELLHYDLDTGIFTWLPRDLRHFRTQKEAEAWNSKFAGRRAGTMSFKKHCGKSYRDIGILRKKYSEHRLAFLYVTGNFPKNDVDHKSGDGCDNRWINLRDVTKFDNMKNTRLRNDNKSGHHGIDWDKKRNMWRARVKVNNVTIYIGRFDNIEDAVQSRNRASLNYGFHSNHGDARPL